MICKKCRRPIRADQPSTLYPVPGYNYHRACDPGGDEINRLVERAERHDRERQ